MHVKVCNGALFVISCNDQNNTHSFSLFFFAPHFMNYVFSSIGSQDGWASEHGTLLSAEAQGFHFQEINRAVIFFFFYFLNINLFIYVFFFPLPLHLFDGVQMLPVVSSLTPFTTLIPLLAVLMLSAFKDACDDYVSPTRWPLGVTKQIFFELRSLIFLSFFFFRTVESI